MSGDFGGSNFGGSNFGGSNPYASPNFAGMPPSDPRQAVKGKVMAPAIALIVVSVIGLVASLFNVAFSFTEAAVDPAAPPFLQEMQKGSTGPLAAAIQGAFVILNLLVIAGGAQMLRFKTWGLALAASVLSMVNFGTCCCLIGLPVGIWSLVVLLQPDVKTAFEVASREM